MAGGRKRREKRRAERRSTKADRKASRREAKSERKASRRSAKLERKQVRQSSKTARTDSRTQRKTAAYEAGIDPNAWIGDTIASVGDTAGNVLTSRFQQQTMQRRDTMSADLAALGLDDPFNRTAMGTREGEAPPPDNNNMLLIAGAGLLAFMMMRK